MSAECYKAVADGSVKRGTSCGGAGGGHYGCKANERTDTAVPYPQSDKMRRGVYDAPPKNVL